MKIGDVFTINSKHCEPVHARLLDLRDPEEFGELPMLSDAAAAAIIAVDVDQVAIFGYTYELPPEQGCALMKVMFVAMQCSNLWLDLYGHELTITDFSSLPATTEEASPASEAEPSQTQAAPLRAASPTPTQGA
jgi:hypothetical protein